MKFDVIHEKKYQQFTVELGEGEEAELAYATPLPNVLDFTHTYVPEQARGKGIAEQLIKEALRFARDNNYKVLATCPVVAKYIKLHTDYQELLKE